jgi:hypothetical protein
MERSPEQKETVNSAFRGLCDAFSPHSVLNSSQHFAQVMLGHLFVRGYRIFTKREDLQVLILFRLHSHTHAQYLYLRISPTQTLSPSEQDGVAILEAVRSIDRMRGEKQKDFRVFFWFFREGCAAQRDKKDFENWLQLRERISATSYWAKPLTEKTKKAANSAEELWAAKQILFAYVDTFGKRYMDNYYLEFERRAGTSYSLPKLVNTVNWIISI